MYIISLLFDENGSASQLGMLRVGAFIVALLVTVMLHEIAHGYSALLYGDTTAKDYGRLTLNPKKHFDLMGLFMMFLVGFGWAKPVPVNANNFEKKRSGMIVVSLAGVVTNMLLAFIFASLDVVFGNIPVVYESVGYYLVYFGWYLSYMMLALNISFALFNILPLFPLDGYRLLSCFVPQSNAYMSFVRKYSMYIFLALILWQYLPIIGDFSPFTLYITELGGWIRNSFTSFWEWVIL